VVGPPDDDLCATDNASWVAYRRQENPPIAQTNVSLLPFFHEKLNSVAMISHIMNKNAAATQFLIPIQTPVLTMDQPLYVSQTKHVQQLPAKYTGIPAAQAFPKDVHVPVYSGPFMPPTDEVPDLREDHKLEYMWLDHQMTICVKPIMRHGQHTMLPDKRILQLREVKLCGYYLPYH